MTLERAALQRSSRRAVLGGAAGAAIAGFAVRPVQARSLRDLDAVLDLAMAQASTSILISRNGEVLAERYAAGWGPDRPREVASVAKSMVAVLIATAVEDGAITSLDQAAADFIPAWREDARAGISLRHMMSMTSGLDDRGLGLRDVAGDQFAINAAMPLRDGPGVRWAYNTAAYHLLFHILAQAVGQTVEAYARIRLFDPLGMDATHWITNEGSGEQGPVTNVYSAWSTARDLARFGQLVLNGGRWNDHPLIGEANLQTLLSPSQDLNASYGLLWWTNARPGRDAFGRGDSLRFPSAPSDTVAALGAGGQAVLVVPSHQLVIVRQGDAPPSSNFADDVLIGVLSAGL